MFTLEQIKSAHGQVKSGADFPSYIKEIKSMGITHYTTYVADGHTDFFGDHDHTVTLPAKYDPISIADLPAIEKFRAELLAHQQGKTDYPTFIKMCAETGIEKWEIRIDKMNCTYFDKLGNKVWEEEIPQ